jgi:hypothetical protein
MAMKSRAELYKILPLNPVVAEIGCAEMLFSRDILDTWKVSKLYLVDNWGKIEGQTGDGNAENEWHHKNYNDGLKRIEPFKDRAVILRGISWDQAVNVPDESLDCVYIDCCHAYECVKRDLAAWIPKVKKGGVIAGHDIANSAYGVLQAVNEITTEWTLIPENGLDASFYFIKK